MTEELPGQLPLWDDEVCDDCGYVCTSSKECVELSGEYEEDDDVEALAISPTDL